MPAPAPNQEAIPGAWFVSQVPILPAATAPGPLANGLIHFSQAKPPTAPPIVLMIKFDQNDGLWKSLSKKASSMPLAKPPTAPPRGVQMSGIKAAPTPEAPRTDRQTALSPYPIAKPNPQAMNSSHPEALACTSAAGTAITMPVPSEVMLSVGSKFGSGSVLATPTLAKSPEYSAIDRLSCSLKLAPPVLT